MLPGSKNYHKPSILFMQTLTQTHSAVKRYTTSKKQVAGVTNSSAAKTFVTGFRQKIILRLIWLTIFGVALKMYKNPFIAFKKARRLRQLRNQYRNNKQLNKYKKINGCYYFSYNAPGWPSKAFNRYAQHLFSRVSSPEANTLHTLIFAITKKCGFKCEHCFEWENLNQPEQLTKEDLLLVIQRFYEMGISHVQLSGGEPLNRFDDIIYLLDNAPAGIDFWIYTTGYQLTKQKAIELKQHGLKGVIISLDDHEAENHDAFRGKPGSFQRALQAVQYAVECKLPVTFSLCATKNFISKENLARYAILAKTAGVSFIQLLEPKAVGHYAGKNVALEEDHLQMLEDFYEKMNYDKAYESFPLVIYHGYYSRRMGCSGSGKDYLYIDTDGDVHNCPFCRRKLFSAVRNSLPEFITQMKTQGCSVYNSCSLKN